MGARCTAFAEMTFWLRRRWCRIASRALCFNVLLMVEFGAVYVTVTGQVALFRACGIKRVEAGAHLRRVDIVRMDVASAL